MTYNTLLLTKNNGLLTIVLNRPDRLNAMTVEMKDEIIRAVREAGSDKTVRVIVITGAGKAFCAGVDYAELGQLTPIGLLDDQERTKEMVNTVIRLSKPVIAAVNGATVAVGWSLVLACDLIIASDRARFTANWVRLGLHPMGGLTHLLFRRVGFSLASDLMLTGRMVESDEAGRVGLVNKVVPADQLDSSTKELARMLLGGAPLAQEMIKASLSQVLSCDLATMMEHEKRADAMLAFTEDSKEARAAIREKREPIFHWR